MSWNFRQELHRDYIICYFLKIYLIADTVSLFLAQATQARVVRPCCGTVELIPATMVASVTSFPVLVLCALVNKVRQLIHDFKV